MMNGRTTRSASSRNYQADYSRQNIDSGDKFQNSIQFDESSENYRCFCNCFHVKVGALIISFGHIFLLLFFFIHSVIIYYQNTNNYPEARGVLNNLVLGSFIAETVALLLALISIILTFIALSRNNAFLIIPHLAIQFVAIICFILLLICGIIALITHSAVCYRLLNSIAFMEHPSYNTVALDTGTLIHVYVMLSVYAVCLIFELWFIAVFYNCYTYLKERSLYMSYCLAFSTPMKTLSSR